MVAVVVIVIAVIMIRNLTIAVIVKATMMSMAAIVIRIIAGKACLDNYSSHQVEKEEVVLMISIVKAIIIIGPLDYLYPAMLTTKLLDLL